MEITLRPEQLADCHDVAALHVETWRVGYHGMVPDQVLAGLDVEQWTQRRRDMMSEPRNPHRSLLAEVDGVLAGFIHFGPRGRLRTGDIDVSVGEILACYVLPAYWGSGVADALMTAALARLPQAEVQLWVLAANERALRFYARHGLLPNGERAFYRPTGSGVDIPELRCALHRDVPG